MGNVAGPGKKGVVPLRFELDDAGDDLRGVERHVDPPAPVVPTTGQLWPRGNLVR